MTARRETYRDHFRPLIYRVLGRLGPHYSLHEKRAALRMRFPYERRRGYMYRVWLDECAIQLGLRPPRFRTIRTVPDSPGQKRFC